MIQFELTDPREAGSFVDAPNYWLEVAEGPPDAPWSGGRSTWRISGAADVTEVIDSVLKRYQQSQIVLYVEGWDALNNQIALARILGHEPQDEDSGSVAVIWVEG